MLILEPEGKRAQENLESLQKLLTGNVEKTGRKSVTINISPEMLGDTLANGKPKENSFATTDMLLTMSSAMDFDKKNKKKSEVEKFIRKFESICSIIKETKKDNFGFYWDYYVPYFIELKEKNFVETFAYIVFASSDEKKVSKWIKSNKNEIEKFYKWSANFDWKNN